MKPQPTDQSTADHIALLETEWVFELAVEKFARENIEQTDCYLCPICEDLHHSPLDAAHCCQPSVEEHYAYQCPTCEKLHDTATKAYWCCDDNQTKIPPDEGLRYQANHIQLEQHGQTRLFN